MNEFIAGDHNQANRTFKEGLFLIQETSQSKLRTDTHTDPITVVIASVDVRIGIRVIV